MISEYRKLILRNGAVVRMALIYGRKHQGKLETMQINWPPEHCDALRECLAKGMSFAEAADAINAKFDAAYSRNATIGRAKRMGLGGPRPAEAAAEGAATELESAAASQKLASARPNRSRSRRLPNGRDASSSAASRSCRAIWR